MFLTVSLHHNKGQLNLTKAHIVTCLGTNARAWVSKLSLQYLRVVFQYRVKIFWHRMSMQDYWYSWYVSLYKNKFWLTIFPFYWKLNAKGPFTFITSIYHGNICWKALMVTLWACCVSLEISSPRSVSCLTFARFLRPALYFLLLELY